MRSLVRTVLCAFALVAVVTAAGGAQSREMLPYDHIHLNEPAGEASVWWEKNIPGGRRITEAPDRIMYGAVRIMFLGARSSGGSQGSVIEHLGFSVADIDAKMRELAAINTKVIEPVKNVPGLSTHKPPRVLNLPGGPPINYFYVAGPSGTRIEIVERPGLKPGE